MRPFLKYWLPLLVWFAVIFIDSTNLMSAEHTSRFIVPFLRWLKPDISIETLASLHFIIRKCAHLSEYAILALLLLRACVSVTNLKRSVVALYASVWGICFLVAATDEFHQTFITSRTPSVHDVMIDACGALLGLAIWRLFASRRSIEPKPAPVRE